MTNFPSAAQAVIVGGGIVGCSTAYHWSRLGWDVVLLERAKLTSGTTFNATGLVGQLRSSANITQLLGYSVDLYKTLEQETGQATGWKMNGGLRLACNQERWTEVKRQATTAHSFGLDMQLLTPREAQDLWPLMVVDDAVGAAFLPTDGQANPSDIPLSLAKGARMAGALIYEDTKVTGIEVDKGVIKGIETSQGYISCGVVIACCGQWTRDFARCVGVNVPLVLVEHQYMVTEPIAGVSPDMTTLRDPDSRLESFTPDGNFVLGEAPELKNFYVGAGFNAYGIAAGGGAGMALAEWVANAGPPYDLWAVDIRRFGWPHFDTDWVRARTYKAYGKHYTMAWPAEEHDSGCPCRKSPLYERLKVDGAVFGEKLGWERPNLYADPDAAEQQRDIYTFERPNWHAAVGREHRAAREAAVLFDQTSLGKFVLKGPDAEAALNWIAANDMSKPVGSLVYTQMLNDQGGIECDLTCVRMAENEYYSVTGTGFVTHDFDHISKNIPAGMNAQLVDVTSAYAVLSLFGPNARPILQAITSDDISNDVLPFGASKTIDIAGCPVSALRVSYVGELGRELHLPTEYAAAVNDAIDHAGAIHGLRNAGFCAIETLRLEKEFRAWSADIGPDHTSFEAGLGFAVKLDTNLAFKGRDALMAQASDGVKKRMTIFTTAPDVILLGRETIYRNGVRVGGLVRPGLAIPSANRLAWALCAAIR